MHIIPAIRVGNLFWHNSIVPGTIIGIVFLGFLIKGKLWKAVVWFCIIAAITATSAASIFAAAIAVAIYFLLTQTQGKLRLILALCLLFSSFYVIQFDALDWIVSLKTEKQLMTVTGRLPVWQWVVEQRIAEKPVLGYGFGVGDTLGQSAPTLAMYHLHNSFLGAIANLGYIGLFFYLGFLMDVFKGGWQYNSGKERAMMIASLVAVLINSMTIPSASSSLSPTWLGHFLVFSIVAMGSKKRFER